MQRITLHIPTCDNNDHPVPRSILGLWEAQIVDIAGGFTVSDAVGAWRSPTGRIYREPVRLYVIDVAEYESLRDAILALANRIRVALAQESVYVTMIPLEVVQVVG